MGSFINSSGISDNQENINFFNFIHPPQKHSHGARLRLLGRRLHEKRKKVKIQKVKYFHSIKVKCPPKDAKRFLIEKKNKQKHKIDPSRYEA